MHVVHLTASTFFGGPERQMLGLARHLPADFRTTFAAFREGGRCADFLAHVRDAGFDGVELANDTPRLRAAVRELAGVLADADVLVCHGYKANVLGRIAARRAGVPVVAVSRGWTGESLKVRVYEALDRLNLRFVDRVVAVSDGQAAKVRRAGVPAERVTVIRNAARMGGDTPAGASPAARLRGLFPTDTRVSHVVLAAGRLSPEKGFAVLADAAVRVLRERPDAGFVLFGEGTERAAIEAIVSRAGVGGRFRMPGFAADLDAVMPGADLVVLPSFTEGLPNVALEASAAGVPVVATAVGGTPEVVADGETGLLVPPGDPAALAVAMLRLLADPVARRRLGDAGRRRMLDHFTFEAQADAYVRLFESLRPAAVCHA